MKRRFRITLDGESYEVEVEEIEGAKHKAPPSPVKSPSVTSEAPHAANPLVAKPAPPRVATEEVVTSPMPGTVITINVKAGDLVKVGDALLILESMKIQNEIPAPRDGRVKEVHVSEGKYVRRREPLVAIEG